MSATKPTKKTAPKVRAPEEVWYDVHKHPAGVPGGMGKSPEHHLRARGWTGHEINEGSGKKTIQYRNLKHPDFVVSYGGGTPQKPDHNFRVLYMGGNTNIPKVTRAYSVAEAMNKVEELHGLHNGLVVQPMTHGASVGPLGYHHAVESPDGLKCHGCGGNDLYQRGFRMRQEEPDLGCNNCGEKMHSPQGHLVVSDEGWEHGDDASGSHYSAASTIKTPPSRQDMTDDDAHPIGPPEVEFPTTPDREHDWPKKQKPQLQEIPAAPAPTQTPRKYSSGPPRSQNDHGTLAGIKRDKTNGGAPCHLCRKAGQVYRRDPMLYRDLLQDSGGLTEDHLHTTSPFHDRVTEALTPLPRYQRPRHPEGQGPADLGRPEYQRLRRSEQQARRNADTAQVAGWHGMELEPDDVKHYPGLRKIVSALQRAQQDTWEEM